MGSPSTFSTFAFTLVFGPPFVPSAPLLISTA